MASAVTHGKDDHSTGWRGKFSLSRRLSENPGRGQHAGNIISGFERKHAQVGQLIEVLGMGLQDCSSYVGFPCVVGGEHKFPISESCTEIVKVSRGCIGRLESDKKRNFGLPRSSLTPLGFWSTVGSRQRLDLWNASLKSGYKMK